MSMAERLVMSRLVRREDADRSAHHEEPDPAVDEKLKDRLQIRQLEKALRRKRQP